MVRRGGGISGGGGERQGDSSGPAWEGGSLEAMPVWTILCCVEAGQEG